MSLPPPATHGVGYVPAAAWPPFAKRRWGIFGLGVTGRAAAPLLLAHGAQLRLIDQNAALGERWRPLFGEADFVLGPVADDALLGCDAVLVSPGIDPRHRALARAQQAGIPLCGEVELLARLAPEAPCIAITGTNGKSTTTALCGELIQSARRAAFVGGNLGTPIAAWLMRGVASDVGVLELSSALIDGTCSAQFEVTCVLNVAPDHFDRYGDIDRYAASKARLLQRLHPHGTAVLNADDPLVRAMAPLVPGRVWWFGRQGPLPGDGLQLCGPDTVRGHGALAALWPQMPIAHSRLLGPHNRQNAMAALLCAQAFLAPASPPAPGLLAAYQAFGGLPHRLQPIGVLGGARWLNDSKATNDASAATAVRAMHGPFVLLLGGRDKGGGYAAVAAALSEQPAKRIIAFGEARHAIAAALSAHGHACCLADSLPDACAQAQAAVGVGDAVLLSPACSSFDAYANYIARGESFAHWVQLAQAREADKEGT